MRRLRRVAQTEFSSGYLTGREPGGLKPASILPRDSGRESHLRVDSTIAGLFGRIHDLRFANLRQSSKLPSCLMRGALCLRTGLLVYTTPHIHLAICASTSPNSSSAAAQTSADTKLAI